MDGRLENDIKIEKVINNTLSELPDFVTEWYLNLRASKKNLTSCNDFINKVRNFLRFINLDTRNILANDINQTKIEEYFIMNQTRKDNNGNIKYTSDSYQQGIWFALNNFLNFLFKRKYISENYISSISKPKNHDLDRINANRKLLTKKDFNKILETIDSGVGSDKAKRYQENMKLRDKCIVSLLMNTGMRETALCEINISDINFDEQKLTVIDKGNKQHVYILNDSMYSLINSWINYRKKYDSESEALFITSRGERITASTVYKLVEKYSEEALGYAISPHKLRSGFCSILYNTTKDVEFVRRAVGHSNIATTQRYIVTNNTEKQRASEIMSSLLM